MSKDQDSNINPSQQKKDKKEKKKDSGQKSGKKEEARNNSRSRSRERASSGRRSRSSTPTKSWIRIPFSHKTPKASLIPAGLPTEMDISRSCFAQAMHSLSDDQLS